MDKQEHFWKLSIVQKNEFEKLQEEHKKLQVQFCILRNALSGAVQEIIDLEKESKELKKIVDRLKAKGKGKDG